MSKNKNNQNDQNSCSWDNKDDCTKGLGCTWYNGECHLVQSCSALSYQDCIRHGYGCAWVGTRNHGHCEVVRSKTSTQHSPSKQGSAQKTNSCSQKTKAICQATIGCVWDETNHICKLPYTASK